MNVRHDKNDMPPVFDHGGINVILILPYGMVWYGIRFKHSQKSSNYFAFKMQFTGYNSLF